MAENIIKNVCHLVCKEAERLGVRVHPVLNEDSFQDNIAELMKHACDVLSHPNYIPLDNWVKSHRKDTTMFNDKTGFSVYTCDPPKWRVFHRHNAAGKFEINVQDIVRYVQKHMSAIIDSMEYPLSKDIGISTAQCINRNVHGEVKRTRQNISKDELIREITEAYKMRIELDPGSEFLGECVCKTENKFDVNARCCQPIYKQEERFMGALKSLGEKHGVQHMQDLLKRVSDPSTPAPILLIHWALVMYTFSPFSRVEDDQIQHFWKFLEAATTYPRGALYKTHITYRLHIYTRQLAPSKWPCNLF